MRGHAKASTGPTNRGVLPLAIFALVAFMALALAAPAGATQFQRPFKEVFGSAAQPSFAFPGAIVVDRATGDVLVADTGSSELIRRFNADGTPAPFAALGTNVIDGREANGKPCAEEPASCDKTPENRLSTFLREIAIDNSGGPTEGNIYVTQTNPGFSEPRVIYIFDADGRYIGQISGPGPVNFSHSCGVAVDAAGSVYVGDSLAVHKFVPTSDVPDSSDHTATFPMPKPVCDLAAGSGPTAGSMFAATTSGNEGDWVIEFDGETGIVDHVFAEGYSLGVAVAPITGHVVARHETGIQLAEFDASGNAAPVRVSRLVPQTPGGRVSKFAIGGTEDVYAEVKFHAPLEVYGPPAIVPTVTADPATSVTGTKATLTGTVNPEGLEVTECVFEYGKTATFGSTAPCEGTISTDSNPHPVRVDLSNLEPNGKTYHYRLVARNANGFEESAKQTFATAHTVATEEATELGATQATLQGTLRPEGLPYTACFFEYGLLNSASFEDQVPCNPSPGAIAPDFSPHGVSAAVDGLEPGTSYRVRLVATNSEGTLQGEALSFTTFGPPRITEVRARDADQSSATLEAKIIPSGFGTTYRFEWGSTAAYGNSVPADFEPFVGSGTEPVRVTAKIGGLAAGRFYHYRVVATNSAGTTEGVDQLLQTTNSCGLPDGRCFELVSPRDPGPTGIPGSTAAAAEFHFQAAKQPGSVAYVVESGLPDSSKGAEVLYKGTRLADGWRSTQLSAPMTARNESSQAESFPSFTRGLSSDLSCAVVSSYLPLTDDASMRLVIEAGGANLYRRNPDGSYTAISRLSPENPGVAGGGYSVAGFSEDCRKVVFTSNFRYPGVSEGGTGSVLYEWEEGALRSLGGVAPGNGNNMTNVVSEDGSRVFFTQGTSVRVREDGSVTRDVSQSETAKPNTGATYQYATPDGSRVFFTANAGLTDESSAKGTDLYEYDLESEDLTNLSVSADPSGAQVKSFLGGSDDGSHVYFAARGQLLPGRGPTLSGNEAAETFSVYGVKEGVVSFVGTVAERDIRSVAIAEPNRSTSRVSPDGRYLLFESSANVTAYDSGGVPQAYLYDAEAASEATVCVSCRQDGQAPVTFAANRPLLPRGVDVTTPLHVEQTLAVGEERARVVFTSFDRLAKGGVEGRGNIYEWSHGQVFHVATEPAGLSGPPSDIEGELLANVNVRFIGASSDGTDLYLATPQTLTWEDGDNRYSVYTARVNGGFAEPPPPPAPCDPNVEGSCQAPVTPGPVTPPPGSASFNGPGNVKPKNSKRKRSKAKRRRAKAKRKRAKAKRRAASKRRAAKARSGKRRAGKRHAKRHANSKRRAGK